jgi:hypothetical protein
MARSWDPLLKGTAQYGSPPCTNYLRVAAFDIEVFILLCYETIYLKEEVNCTEPSRSVSVPGKVEH